MTELAIVSSAGVEAHQSMTDATTLVVSADDGASGYATQTSWSADGVDPAAVGREAAEKAARTRGAKTIEPAPYRAVLEPYAFADLINYFALRRVRRERAARGALVPRRAARREDHGREGVDRRRRARPARPPEALRLRRRAEAARAADRERRRARRRLGPHERGPRRRRPRDDGPRAAAGLPPVRARSRSRSRVDGGEVDSVEELVRARRRRDLRDAPPLPRHRRPARRRDHRHDAGRDVPDPRRQDRRAARQPSLHRLRAPDARGRPGSRRASSSS